MYADFHSSILYCFRRCFVSAYLGFMPTVTIYSNSAGAFTATTFVGSVAFLMAVGGVFFWLGNTIPILNKLFRRSLSSATPWFLFDELSGTGT